MKRITGVFIFSLFAACLAAAAAPVMAQEWSAAQKEVWGVEQLSWEANLAGDVEGVLAVFHPDYVGWINVSPVPQDKASTRKFISHYSKVNKLLVYDITPLSIRIYGNAAIVHYYFTTVYTNPEGMDMSETGRWTDVFLKQGDKWLLIGDHGGPDLNE